MGGTSPSGVTGRLQHVISNGPEGPAHSIVAGVPALHGASTSIREAYGRSAAEPAPLARCWARSCSLSRSASHNRFITALSLGKVARYLMIFALVIQRPNAIDSQTICGCAETPEGERLPSAGV
jgi:hypothetical protein